MLRKLVIAAVLLALLAGVAAVAWKACGMPPLRLVVQYGLPAQSGQALETRTCGLLAFTKVHPGYCRSAMSLRRGSACLTSVISDHLPILFGARSTRMESWCRDGWILTETPYWIAELKCSIRELWEAPFAPVIENGRFDGADALSDLFSSRPRGVVRLSTQDELIMASVVGAIPSIERTFQLCLGEDAAKPGVLPIAQEWNDGEDALRARISFGVSGPISLYLTWLPAEGD